MKNRLIGKITALAGIAMMAATVSSCEDETPQTEEPRLVVEGWINNNGYPEVLLTMSAVPDGNDNDIASTIIKWGIVKLDDGEQQIVLTGGPKNEIFPPYHYYSFDMKGIPGRRYTLTAEYRGMQIESSVVMPEPTAITSLRIEPVEGCDTLRSILVTFTAPDDCPAYYHISSCIEGIDSRFYPSMLGAVEALTPGAEMEVPVYRSRSSLTDDTFVPQYPVGHRVAVMLERVSEEVFRFWRAYDNASIVSGSVFVGSPGSLPSNVSGGYGVWSAQGIARETIKVE